MATMATCMLFPYERTMYFLPLRVIHIVFPEELVHSRLSFSEFSVEWQLPLPPRLPGTGPLLALDWQHGRKSRRSCQLCVFCVCVSPQLRPLLLMTDPQTLVSGNGNPLLQQTVVSMVPLPVHPCPFSCLTYDVIRSSGRDFFSAFFSFFSHPSFARQADLRVDVKGEFTPGTT